MLPPRLSAYAVPLAVVVTVLVASGFAYDAALRRGLRERAHDELQAVAELQVGMVSRWLVERTNDVSGMASSPTVLALLEGGAARPHEAVRGYLGAARARGAFEAATVLDASGQVVLSTSDAPLQPGARAVAEGAMGSGTPETSDLHPAGDGVDFFVAAPIVSGDRITGALVFVVEATRTLLPFIERWPTASRTAEVLLVERTPGGLRFVSRPRHPIVGDLEELEELRGDDVLPLSTQAAGLRASHLLTGLDYRGVPALGVARPVPGTAWILLAKIDEVEALDERVARQAIVVVVVALVGAAAAALAYALERSRRRALRVEIEAEQARARAEVEARRTAEERLVERRAAEEALRASEERLQQVIDATEAAEWEVDFARKKVRFGVGWKRIAGFAAGEADLARLWSLIHPADVPNMRSGLEAHYRGESPVFVAEHRMRTRTGAWRWLYCRAKVVARDASGEPLRLIGTSVDVTERRRATEQLAVAERMASLGTLAAGVAHEINNPLTYVVANLGFAEGALGELATRAGPGAGPLAAELQEAIVEARGGALRVRDIVRDLKTFSRGDDGRPGLVDLRRVIESCVAMARAETKHRARVVLELAEVAPIAGNEAKLGQVVLNLLVNAAQAISNGGVEANEIRVRLATHGDDVTVEVRDSGCGIDPADLPRLFDPFFTTKPVGQGTGLGLSISHRIVSDLGGRIDIDSTPGRGSTFRVVLPRGVAPGVPARAPAAPSLPRRRVLVVDDEPAVVAAVRRILARHHEVTTFVDAREALRHLRSGAPYDVLLCDMVMPGMSGLELHESLRSVAPRLAEATVLMTGGAFTAQAASALARSALPRLDKPFSADQLLAAVSLRPNAALAGG